MRRPCKNIVLVRVVNSMTEFKQIIGRGTRVRDDYGKLFFNILDYTGSATRLFADPEFDGEPTVETEQAINEEGEPIGEEEIVTEEDETGEPECGQEEQEGEGLPPDDEPTGGRQKFYFDGGQVEIAAHLVYELDPDGKQLRVVQFTDYTADKVRTLYRNAAELRGDWADPERRRPSSNGWRSAASTSMSWPKPPTSPTPTRSTCSVTWPSTLRCAPAGSGRSGFDPSGLISSPSTLPRPG